MVMKIRALLILSWILLITNGFQESISKYKEPKAEPFSCSNIEPHHYQCNQLGYGFKQACMAPPDKPHIMTVTNKPKKSLTILCDECPFQFTPNNCTTLLRDFGNVELFHMSFCLLPTLSLKDFMKSLMIDVTNVYKVNFIYNYQTIGVSKDKLTKLFDDLNLVSNLSLSYSELTSLPKLKGAPNLTFLSLEGNFLQELHENVFDETPLLIELILDHNQIGNLEAGAFKNLFKLKILSLKDNNFKKLTSSIFSDLRSLEILDLSQNSRKRRYLAERGTASNFKALSSRFPSPRLNTKCRITDYFGTDNGKTFSSLQGLRHVFMNNCDIQYLPVDLFRFSPNISVISLELNRLTAIESDLFYNITNLQFVSFENNRITEIPLKLFSSSPNISNINFSINRLMYISRACFEGLSDLKFLNLSFNRLLSIEVETFISLTSLIDIDLSHNILTSRSFIFEEGLMADEQDVVFGQCQKLKRILLNNNQIGFMFNDWRNLSQLKDLDLSSNVISSIETDNLLFSSEHPVTLNLKGNDIQKLDLRDIEQQISTLNSIDKRPKVRVIIGSQTLNCDCSLHEFVLLYVQRTPFDRSLKVRRVIDFQFDDDLLRCSVINGLSNKFLYSISSSDLTCSLTDHLLDNKDHPCPRNCTCSFRIHTRALIVNCTGGNLTEIPGDIPLINTILETELIMTQNQLIELPKSEFFKKYSVVIIDVSHNQIEDISDVRFPDNLRILKLDSNNLTKVTEATLNHWEQLKDFTELTLHNNPWHCDCLGEKLRDFLNRQSKIKIAFQDNITCSSNQEPVRSLESDERCAFTYYELVLIGGFSLGVFGFIGLIAALYYKYQTEIKVWLFTHQMCLRFVTEYELDKDKVYDAFVSYSNLDEAFVGEILVPELESGPNPFKLCVHVRDWMPGQFIHEQIIQSVNESRRTIIVLSKNFLESVWSRLEFQTAHTQALSEGRSRVIIILLGDIGAKEDLDPELQAYLNTNTYVEWGDNWFWKKLKYAMPHPLEYLKKRDKKLNGCSNADGGGEGVLYSSIRSRERLSSESRNKDQ